MAAALRVTRAVGRDEPHNYLGRDVAAGEVFYRCTLATYGCVNTMLGVALTEKPDEYPFFEFPRDAVEEVALHTGGGPR